MGIYRYNAQRGKGSKMRTAEEILDSFGGGNLCKQEILEAMHIYAQEFLASRGSGQSAVPSDGLLINFAEYYMDRVEEMGIDSVASAEYYLNFWKKSEALPDNARGAYGVRKRNLTGGI
jgi:hypothetical protein